MPLQAPISDLTQRVSTNQKARLQERVTDRLPSEVCSISFVILINSKCQLDSPIIQQKKNNKANLQVYLSFTC
jgi:hypothetical protein